MSDGQGATMRGRDEMLERILTQITDLTAEVRHLNQRMDARAAEIGKLSDRVSALEVRLAVNDKQTARNAGWFDHIFKGVMAVFMGYVALRLGLK